ncbi:unnamed protein product, partial [marine sediment metagenome]
FYYSFSNCLNDERFAARYGIYIGEKSMFNLFRNLESCLPVSISSMPSTTKKILQPNRKKPAMACHILGLGSAYYIGLLVNECKD